MSPDMFALHPETLIAIAVLSVTTVFTRMAGLFIPVRWTQEGRIGAAFSALPVAVLTALIAPAILTHSWKDAVAAILVAVLAPRMPMAITVAIGVAVIAALRLGLSP